MLKKFNLDGKKRLQTIPFNFWHATFGMNGFNELLEEKQFGLLGQQPIMQMTMLKQFYST
jgi:hypothetical protein